jgi:putative transposase
MINRRVYRFRLVPTPAQEQRLFQFAGCCRWVWNWALLEKQEHYKSEKKGLQTSVLKAQLPKLKKQSETAWLGECDSQALQEVLRDLDRAYANFFAKQAGFPKLKSRTKCRPAFRVSQRVSIVAGCVTIPKIGPIRIRQSRAVTGTTKSATIKQDACGDWHVTLVAEFTVPEAQVPAEKIVGIDLGLKEFAVLSTGERIAAPRFFRHQQHKLKKAQRQLARRKKGSHRRAKAKKRVARIHRQTTNRRADFIHKFTTGIIRQFDAVCIEDLSVKGMARTNRAKSVLDAALRETRRQLEYKALWRGKRVAVIDRWYPSSKTCHHCAWIYQNLIEKERSWICGGCGAIVDRDWNASLNIRAEGAKQFTVAVGHTETLNTRGPDVRLPFVEAVGVEARIPQL